jgi:hypothetical protein
MQKQCKMLPPAVTKELLEKELDEAEEKAHKSLAQYKFMNFGYWAAIWVHINRIGGFHRANPFIHYVVLARKIRKGGEIDSERKPG